jgi:hypothetical protein
VNYHKVKLADTCELTASYYAWCVETFGAPFQGKKRDKNCKWTDMRWYQNGKFSFLKERTI